MKQSSSRLARGTTKLQPTNLFTPIRTLGVGTFGAVFLAVDANHRNVAIKKVFLDPHFKNRELSIVAKLQHPNCLHYITHYLTKEGPNHDCFLHLVTDYMPESLTSFAVQHPVPSLIYIKVFGFQLFSGLAYLHAHGVCHRDIKPSNVLVNSSTGEAQICDFGSAKFLRPDEASVSYIATRSYRAPELLLDCQKYSPAVDVWAAACVLCELCLRGRPIFNAINNNEMLNAIGRIIGGPQPGDLDTFQHSKRFSYLGRAEGLKKILPSWTGPTFLDLMTQIFVYNPQRRLTAAMAMTHPFFQELFQPGTNLPNGAPLPSFLNKMTTYTRMCRNYPIGPTPS